MPLDEQAIDGTKATLATVRECPREVLSAPARTSWRRIFAS